MNATKRDPVDVVVGWLIGSGLFVLMLCVFVMSPYAYVAILGTLGIIGTLLVTMTMAGSLYSRGNLLDWIIAGDIIQCGFEIVGAIAKGMASLND